MAPGGDDFQGIRCGGSLIVAWQVRDKNVLVVGGGNVAAGRIVNVLDADAIVTLVCPRKGMNPEVAYRVETGQVAHYRDKEFDDSDLDGTDMCLTAVDSPEVSTRIWKLCKERKIPVNVADVPSECDFYFGSQHRDGPLQIMISTNGTAPKLANLIRLRIAECLPSNAGRACLNVGKLRRKLRGIAPGTAEGSKRMRWMVEVCERYSLDQLVQLTDDDMNRLLSYYRDGIVPPYAQVHEVKPVYEFDGSFGWHC